MMMEKIADSEDRAHDQRRFGQMPNTPCRTTAMTKAFQYFKPEHGDER